MSILYVLCGIPGAGKSTVANKMIHHIDNLIIISTDEIRKELFKDESSQQNNELVFRTAYNRIEQSLKAGKNVVFDATNIRNADRKRVIRRFATSASKIIGIFVNTPFNVCIERNENRDRKVPREVIHRMYDRLQLITDREGFSEYYTIKG